MVALKQWIVSLKLHPSQLRWTVRRMVVVMVMMVTDGGGGRWWMEMRWW